MKTKSSFVRTALVLMAVLLISVLCISGCCKKDGECSSCDSSAGQSEDAQKGPVTTIAQLQEFAPKTAYDRLNKMLAEYCSVNPACKLPEGIDMNKIVWVIKNDGDTIKGAEGRYTAVGPESTGLHRFSFTADISVNDFLYKDTGLISHSFSSSDMSVSNEKNEMYKPLGLKMAKKKGIKEEDTLLVLSNMKKPEEGASEKEFVVYVETRTEQYKCTFTVETADTVEELAAKIDEGKYKITEEKTTSYGSVFLDSKAEDKSFD